MGFESPWLLLGMLGASVPVIIHLINRQRAVVKRFAAIEYLLLSDKRLAQRLRLRQWLVLALRVLLMIAIPFALAKPYLDKDLRLETANVSDPGAIVLVIDDSLSMRASLPGEGDETLLDRALDYATQLVRSGGSRTGFAIVAAGAPARLLTPGIVYERQTLERALSRITPTSRAGDMEAAMREAERVLSVSREANRRVLVIGDQAAHAWSELKDPWALSQPPAVELVDVREARSLDNMAVTGVTIRPASEIGADQVHVEVTVANFGSEPASGRVSVSLGERATVATVTDVPPAGETSVALVDHLPPRGTTISGTASLLPDALPADDIWYFEVDFGGMVHVAVVDGAPSDVPWLDELFFLRPALASSPGDQARLHVSWLALADLEPSRLQHVDVVLMANVGALDPAQRIALQGFVGAGGGLLITAGDQLSQDTAPSWGDLLPYPIRAIKEVAAPDDPEAALNVLRFGDVDFDHPALAEFATVDDVSLFRARTWTYALLDTATREGGHVLANYTGGQPALVEAPVGRGRAMMLTTTIDRDWSDLVIRTSFVPLIQQLVLYLAGRLEGSDSGGLRVGESAGVTLPEGQGGLMLERPDGSEVPVEEPQVVEGADTPRSVTLVDLDLPGHYTLRRRVGSASPTVFSVNGDRRESDLALADLTRVSAVLERPGAGTSPATAAVASVDDGSGPDSSKQRLWPVVLVGLFWLLASEAWLVIRS